MLTGGGGKAASKGAKKRSSYVSVDGLGYARSPPRMRTSPLGRSFAVGLAWLSGLPDVEVTSPICACRNTVAEDLHHSAGDVQEL